MSIRNIKRSTQPVEIYRSVNNQKTHIKRVYKVIDNEPVIVWDVGNTTIIRGWISTDGIITLQNTTEYISRLYLPTKNSTGTIDFDEQTTFGYENFTGTIDWGDGTVENYNSFYRTDDIYSINHQYDSNYITQHTQDNGVWVEIQIDCDLPYISRTRFLVDDDYASSFWMLHSIVFADSIKYFDGAIKPSDTGCETFTLTYPNNPYCKIIQSLAYNCNYINKVDLTNVNADYLGITRLITNLNYSEYAYNSNMYMWYGTFYNCTKLETIKISDKIKVFGDNCFYDNNSLTTINIPTSLEIIGRNCFYNCYLLKPFVIPNGVKYILDLAFYGVGKKLHTINRNPEYNSNYSWYLDAPRDNYKYYPLNVDVEIDEFVIPNSVEYIGYDCFVTNWYRVLSLGTGIKYLGYMFHSSRDNYINEVIYRGTVDDWFKIKFVNQILNVPNAIGFTDFFENGVVPDGYFYSNTSNVKRIICNDGIIINPYAIGTLSDGTAVNPNVYGYNCFDNTGKSIKENFLILNI